MTAPTLFPSKQVQDGLAPWAKVLVLVMVCIQTTFCWMAAPRSLRGDVDFRAFYAAGIMVRDGSAADLYNMQQVNAYQQRIFGASGRTLPFLYPPVAALPFSSLSFLSYAHAFQAMLCLNLLGLFATACVFTRSHAAGMFSSFWLLALFLCFFPTAIALMQGQISFALLFIFSVAHMLISRGRGFRGGLCMALALVKFQLVLPIFLLYVLWRKWDVVLGFCSSGSVLIATSLLLTGAAGAKAYVACLRGLGSAMMLAPGVAQARFGMQASAEPNLHGIVTALFGSGVCQGVLTVAASVAVIAWSARNTGTVAKAMPAALLVSYHMQPYDLLLLLLPLTLSMYEVEGPRKQLPGAQNAWWIISVALLTAPVSAYLLVKGQMVWLACAVFAVLLAANQRRTPDLLGEPVAA